MLKNKKSKKGGDYNTRTRNTKKGSKVSIFWPNHREIKSNLCVLRNIFPELCGTSDYALNQIV